MSDGKLRAYYWEIFTAVAKVANILDVTHRAYSFPSEDEVECTASLYVTLVFKDGSRLIVHAWLDTATEVREYNYAYVYLDAEMNRVFQYDDAPHHPDLSTHPHHVHKGRMSVRGPDRALPLDISRVDFVTVLNKVMREYLGHSEAD